MFRTAAGDRFGLGVVDIKSTEIETADKIARALETRRERARGRGIKYIHPDFGFWMLKRSIADGKIVRSSRAGTCITGAN